MYTLNSPNPSVRKRNNLQYLFVLQNKPHVTKIFLYPHT